MEAKHADYPCRTDGRCQYAIDHGAEGLGHCPKGKCCMPEYEDDEPCARCHGDGMDPWNDYMFSCPECDGRDAL